MEQRQQVSEALAETEERYQLLIESVTDYAIFSVDVHGVLRDWNKGAERIKGYRAKEVIGRHFSIFYTPEDRDRGLPVSSLEQAAREGRYDAEGLRVRKDGTQFLANVVIHPIHDRRGSLVGFAKITRDITRQRELEERLRQAQKMEAIGQLTGGVAHDFNNHLTVIFANLDLAQRRTADPARLDQALSGAMKGAERAASLTSQLLAFARRQPLKPEAIDIARLLTQTSGLLDRVLGERIKIETIRSGGQWSAYCDSDQLQAALLNLAVNARDAMPDGGRLTLEVANTYLDDEYAAAHPDVKPGPYVMVAVTDTGVGMSREVMQRAFDPFFTTKPEGQGTGLGLSQVFGFIILAKRPVSLVFTDVVMPGPISSRELANRARALPPGVKVLFTSGYTQNAVVHGGRLDDGVELISKPYRRDQLARRFRRLLASTGEETTFG
jgi:PAS domain S-box-containing protein